MYIDLAMFRFEQGLNERDNLWSFTLDYIFKGQNFLGVGFDDIGKVLKLNGFSNSSTHNYYFDTLLTYGVVPLVLNIFISLNVLYTMFLKNSKYLPVFLFLLIQSNAILISFGGIGFLSALLSMLAATQMVKTKYNEVSSK